MSAAGMPWDQPLAGLVIRQSSRRFFRTNQIRLTDRGRENAFAAVARLAAAHDAFFRPLETETGQ